tara:strand:- start:130 stop:384 length:255 start_codon:yes stop_codon:yes gene_type:complete
MSNSDFRLTDTAIGHIAQLLQVAILTGTDIIDNLRAARFVTDEGTIDVSPEWRETFEAHIQTMMAEAQESQPTSEEDKNRFKLP